MQLVQEFGRGPSDTGSGDVGDIAVHRGAGAGSQRFPLRCRTIFYKSPAF